MADFFPDDADPTLPGHPDPYPYFHALREHDPVHFSPVMNGWVLTRYADAIAYLRDHRFSRAKLLDAMRAQFGDGPILRLQSGELAFLDPPRHTALKNVLGKLLAPQVIEPMRAEVESLVARLLDHLAGAHRMDVIADFAYELPAETMCTMLAVPQPDRIRMREYVEGVVLARGVVRTPEMIAAGDRAAREFVEYLDGLVRDRRAHPGNDFLSALLETNRVSDDEAATIAEQMFTAGHATTRNLIGNAVLALLRNSAQLARLRENPALIEGTIEETLRYDPPTQAPSPQIALEDVEVGGRTIRAGERVSVLLGAANRDPARFAEPDHFDITRADNEHLSFSHGIHFCVGSAVARLEAQIAVGALVERMPSLRLATNEFKWHKMGRFRGLVALPVEF
ncbi:MAG TPA: cytochrome P450 [Candidatus Binataceae bacterium]|nr:cytochrome P450 [Candidatus Binataceae bacterium]